MFAMEITDRSQSPSISKVLRQRPGPEDVEAADVGGKLDLVATAEQGNDSYAALKQAYALLQDTSHILGHQ
jgi:hypothetical protein